MEWKGNTATTTIKLNIETLEDISKLELLAEIAKKHSYQEIENIFK